MFLILLQRRFRGKKTTLKRVPTWLSLYIEISYERMEVLFLNTICCLLGSLKQPYNNKVTILVVTNIVITSCSQLNWPTLWLLLAANWTDQHCDYFLQPIELTNIVITSCSQLNWPTLWLLLAANWTDQHCDNFLQPIELLHCCGESY